MRPYLEFFVEEEFRGWFYRIDPRLLIMTDVFRFMWNAPVYVSPHPNAIGRNLGPNSESDHNIDRWGMVRGIDLMPDGMTTVAGMRRALQIARQIGFTAIGIYPFWISQDGMRPGIHLGVRRSRSPGDPALWGAIRNEKGHQIMVSVDEAIRQFERGRSV